MASTSTERSTPEPAKRQRCAARPRYPPFHSFSTRTRSIMVLVSLDASHEVSYAGGGLVLTSRTEVLLSSVEELLLVLDELRSSFDVPGVASRLLCKLLVEWLLSPDRAVKEAWIVARCVDHIAEVDPALVTQAWIDRSSALVEAEEITSLLTLPTFVRLLARLLELPCTPKRRDASLRFLVTWLHAHPAPTASDGDVERDARRLLASGPCKHYDLSRYLDSSSQLLLKLLIGALYRREIAPPL
jgi:hypothetical protein